MSDVHLHYPAGTLMLPIRMSGFVPVIGYIYRYVASFVSVNLHGREINTTHLYAACYWADHDVSVRQDMQIKQKLATKVSAA